jgi:hypothetical protein
LTDKLKFLAVDSVGAAEPGAALPPLVLWPAQPATNNARPEASTNPIFRFMASSFNLGTPPLTELTWLSAARLSRAKIHRLEKLANPP